MVRMNRGVYSAAKARMGQKSPSGRRKAPGGMAAARKRMTSSAPMGRKAGPYSGSKRPSRPKRNAKSFLSKAKRPSTGSPARRATGLATRAGKAGARAGISRPQKRAAPKRPSRTASRAGAGARRSARRATRRLGF